LKEVTYYRRDGARFGYPAAWGDLVGVIPCPVIPKQARDAEGDKSENKYSNCYYIFRAVDGTVRRAKVQAEDFIEPGTPNATVSPAKVRPDNLRSGIKSYHFWVVDLMPVTEAQALDKNK
jgi:hypothetical protein